MTVGNGRRLASLVAACVLAAAFGSPAAAPAASKQAKLVVKSVRPAPSEAKPLHRVWKASTPVHLEVKIKNTGGAASSGDPWGRILTRQSGGLGFLRDAGFTIGRLGPGKSRTVDAEALGPSAPDAITSVETRACVSIRGGEDPAEGNRADCRDGPDFAVVPEAYDGSVSATQPLFGYGKIVSLGDPRFTYDSKASEKRGLFIYRATGQLVHTVSGSNGTCSLSGSGSAAFTRKETELVLDTDLLDYQGNITHPQVVNATQTCNGTPFPAPIRTGGLRIGPDTREALSEGDPLKGNTDVGGIAFEWNLIPE